MSEWIHVVSATKIPTLLGSASTPFKFYPDGFDPNSTGSFGEDQATMYLPVHRPAQPSLNPVLEKAVLQETAGTNGDLYPGKYVAPSWAVGYDIVEQDIETSRRYKTAQLNAARDAKQQAGFTLQNGESILLPLVPSFRDELQSALAFADQGVAQLKIPSTYTFTFAGIDNVSVTMGIDTLRGAVVDFCAEYYAMNGVYVAALDSITSAQTPVDVDAVTWTF